MEFVTITTALWDDPWVIDLAPDERLLWLYLCTSPNNDNGFIEYAERLWRIRTGLEAEQIGHALSKFERAGKIARDGDMILVVKHLSHRRLQGNSRHGAVRRLGKYAEKYPDLVRKCVAANDLEELYIRLVPTNSANEIANSACSLIRTDQNRSEQSRTEHICVANAPPLIFDPEEQSILDALKVISERGQGDYDAEATVKYLRTNLGKDYPYSVILQAARKVDAWLLNPKNRREVWSHARLRKFCEGIELPAGTRQTAVDKMELVK